MRVDIVEAGSIVTFRGETDDALLEQIQLQWAHLSYKNVDSHVPLCSSDKVRVRDVLLNDTLLIILQIVDVINEGDLPSSTEICGFTYPNLLARIAFCPLPRELLYKCFRLCW